MERKVIQMHLELAKGIPTAQYLTDKGKSIRRQPKIQTPLCACHGHSGNVLVINRGRHNATNTAAQIQAEKTYSDFLAWSQTALYCILAFLIILAFFNFGASGTESQHNGEIYIPMNVG